MFGLDLTRARAKVQPSLAPVDSRGGWWPIVRESFAGAWQRNVDLSVQNVVTNPTVWACATLIARDVSRLWIKLVEKDDDGICSETTNSAYSPVLDAPNHYQTRVKFIEYWILTKLLHGNTYVLKERDNRGGFASGNVTSLYILDSSRVQVLVAPDGSVFYQYGQDNLAGIERDSVVFPASEIIHDMMVPLYHQLCGVSPIHASAMAALQGLAIQKNSSQLFANGSQPGGIILTPHPITKEQAERLRAAWESNHAGAENIGRVAVLPEGMDYKPMITMSAVDAQLIDQLKWSDERICSTFHVPGYKIGIGPAPPYTDIQSINLEYYNTALAPEIENLEELLTKGLEMTPRLSVEFDLMALLRMDSKTQTDVLKTLAGAGLISIDEGRAELDRKPVKDGGGAIPMLQEQNWPVTLLSKRTAAPGAMPAQADASAPAASESDQMMNIEQSFADLLAQELAA